MWRPGRQRRYGLLMQRLRRVLVAASLFAACEAAPLPEPASESGSSSDATTLSSPDSSDGTTSDTDTDTDTSTETEAEIEVSVNWIEVAASDYKLELQPAFETEISDYTALADGPDITVYVDVIVDADVNGVLVNEIPAGLVGFRTWRSAEQTQLVSPTFATVEIVTEGPQAPIYTIDVTIPGG